MRVYNEDGTLDRKETTRISRLTKMSIKLKIHGGTLTDKILCTTCVHGTVMEDQNSNEAIYCGMIESTIENKIVKCSSYHEASAVSLKAMEEIAWILVTNRTRRKVGFHPSVELKAKNYGMLPDPDEVINTEE